MLLAIVVLALGLGIGMGSGAGIMAQGAGCGGGAEAPGAGGWLREPDTVSVSIIGDVMLHKEQLAAAWRTGQATAHDVCGLADGEHIPVDEGYNFHPFLDSLKADFAASDIVAANMEFTLGGKPYSGYPAFSAPDSYARYVAGMGVNVFLTANNHIMDRGERGLRRTREVYRQMADVNDTTYHGPRILAYTQDNPTYVKVRGIKIAFINCTYGCNAALSSSHEPWAVVPLNKDREAVREAIAKARRDTAAIVIACPHWGEEYVLKHNSAQRDFAEFLVDCGVDAIVGAHPHCVQDFEMIQDVPVYYSLGNAVSNMSAANTQLELMVRLRIVRDCFGRVALLDASHQYLWCSHPGRFCPDYCVLKVTDMLDRRSQWLSPYDYDNMLATYLRLKVGE